MRAARFACVGLGGFVVQLVALRAMTDAGMLPAMATAVAVEAAILHNFFWHERWTWKDRPRVDQLLTRFVRFNGLTALISIGGNVALTAAFTGALHLPLLGANALAVLVLGAVNFAAADRAVFTRSKTSPPSPPGVGRAATFLAQWRSDHTAL